ncbi:hypothetical protein BC832DRAFT_449225 [Gaertneriomyces semiglobifer]|nr:hypothetical protein BC832DRAFT_449225 [Gaertneriomyces semiglobifer]
MSPKSSRVCCELTFFLILGTRISTPWLRLETLDAAIICSDVWNWITQVEDLEEGFFQQKYFLRFDFWRSGGRNPGGNVQARMNQDDVKCHVHHMHPGDITRLLFWTGVRVERRNVA